ncbi:hypothetical protein IWW57_002442 [Coemansia sp. S610]|nr:hypothetical protein IWW57_002442 [Coemansia sp. S610]
MLASRLFQLVDCIEYGHAYDDAADALLEPQLDNVCNLVHIKLTLDAGTGHIVQFAQRNALALQYLSIFPMKKRAHICLKMMT